jgi:hypothetical protein
MAEPISTNNEEQEEQPVDFYNQPDVLGMKRGVMDLEAEQKQDLNEQKWGEQSEVTRGAKIYSKQAIWGFSIALSPLFGAVLLILNLRAIGNKKAAVPVLFTAIVFTLISILVSTTDGYKPRNLTLFINMAGGVFLTEYFFRKYIPKPELFQKRNVVVPLIISILIIGLFILAYLYSKGM